MAVAFLAARRSLTVMVDQRVASAASFTRGRPSFSRSASPARRLATAPAAAPAAAAAAASPASPGSNRSAADTSTNSKAWSSDHSTNRS